ncbi:MAG: hypothetical protein C6I00_03025 [Nitratiruptor sp.]|nr:hypothetical protein [Nitratiruptor sp.]NPA84327.1 hypothetical protein [Campylobacterota bacterium]
MDLKALSPQELERLSQEAIAKRDVAELYRLLEHYRQIGALEEEAALGTHILTLSLDHLAQRLLSQEPFDLEDPLDRSIVRGVYEHALERWERGDMAGAKELFLSLIPLVDEPALSKGLLLALALSAQGEPLQRFVEEFVDLDALDPGSIFFNAFTPAADNYLTQARQIIEAELERTRKWNQ